MRLCIITRREEDHVVAGAKGHELQTPKPHDGAEAKWVKTVRHSGFSWRKKVSHVEGPYLARQLSVSGLGVQALTSDESACPLTQMVIQEEHRGFILVQANDCPTSSGGSKHVLSLHPRVLVVGVYKLAAREGRGPKSQLDGWMCGM